MIKTRRNLSRIILLAVCLSVLGAAPATAEDTPSEKEVGAVFPEKKWFENVHMSGFVDVYYSYNFNNPDSMKNGPGTNFDFEHNTFSLNLAELVFHKDPDPVGFRVDLDFGPTTDFVHCGTVNCGGTVNVTQNADKDVTATSFTPAAESTYKNIQQAYVSWATPLGAKLEVGKFVTHMGAEVIESKDNWNYTRGLLFCCAIPYYHSGVRANYAINDLAFVNGYVYNGWNNVVENNDSKTFGATIGITPIPQLPILLNWIGPEKSEGVFRDRQVYEAIATFNATDHLSFMADYNYGTQEDADPTSPTFGDDITWSGVAAYAKYAFTDTDAAVVRYERFDDEDGFGGFGTKLKEFTVTYEHKHGNGLIARLEYRRDMADDKIYETEDGTDATTGDLIDPKDSQSRIVVGLIYAF